MPRCALPEHLQKDPFAEGDGTDWDNSAQRWWDRGWTAFGYRCEKGWTWLRQGIPWTKYSIPYFPVLRQWRKFPKLLLGYNVTRWMGEQDHSVVFVAPYVNKWLFPWSRRTNLPATEMQNSNEQFDEPILLEHLRNYGPSPIQYWADVHFQLTWPLHVVFSINKKRKNKTPLRFFVRFGFGRWDSLDMYFAAFDITVQTDFN